MPLLDNGMQINTSHPLIRLLSLFEYMLDESGTAENKVELLFSHDKLLLVTEEMLV